METSTIELHLRDPEGLRDLWLDDVPDGGVFVPGVFPVSAGTDVLVRVCVDNVAGATATTLLTATVMWRRLPPRVGSHAPASLRPGVGVAFHPDMRARAVFLERLSHGATAEGRSAVRYPARLPGELRTTSGAAFGVEDRPLSTTVLDVGVRGARIEVKNPAFWEPGQRVELAVVLPRSGEVNLSPLVGHITWRSVSREGRTSLGVRLDLESKEERLHWAKIVTRVREALEDHPLRSSGGGQVG